MLKVLLFISVFGASGVKTDIIEFTDMNNCLKAKKTIEEMHRAWAECVENVSGYARDRSHRDGD